MKKNTCLVNSFLIAALLLFEVYTSQAQQGNELVNSFLQNEKANHNWLNSDISEWRFSDYYTNESTGLTHAYVQQMHKGIPVYNALSVFAIKQNAVVYFNAGLVEHLQEKINASRPKLSPTDAVETATEYLSIRLSNAAVMVKSDFGKNEFEFKSDDLSRSPVKVNLVYQPINNSVLLAWNVSIEMKSENHWWNIRLDALTGEYLDKNDYVTECNFGLIDNCLSDFEPEDALLNVASVPPLPSPVYNVFALPVEAPTFGSRTVLNDPSDVTASPYGWHDVDGIAGADYTITRGNNVFAYEDANNDNLPGYSPDGGSNLVFDFPYNFSSAPLVNQDASLTNLFYVNNAVHDKLFHLGFDEVSGNFQQNNYTSSGLGNDPVLAEGFDGSGSNNANFSTPPDGSSGRMQMYLWYYGSPTADADFDNGVITHEYGHGVSNRLTGGPSNVGCLGNAEQGGEGWSDWLALMLTIEPGDSGAMARGIGTYVKGQATTGAGIRRYPYSTNMSINPQTYASLPGSSNVHQRGEIWCDAIWDMSWFLINQLGFNADPKVDSAGNNIAIQLVLEGMKLQPCSPGYIDARNAILLADQLLYNNAHRCIIWEAFARRGMGYGASQGSSNSTTDQTVSFAMPYFCMPPTQLPQAGFTASSTSVACTGTVNFTDTSTQSFDWLWDFGDQSSSTLQNPSHTYNTPGNYNVKLRVTNPLGADSVIKSSYITVAPTFSVTSTASPALVCNGNQVTLNASASGSNSVNYSVTNISYAPLTGTGTSVSLGDDVMSSAKPIGFTFNFYGQNYTNFYICSNGYITFTSGQSASPVYGPVLPTTATPYNVIALAWNDLNPSRAGSVIDYFTTGISPNRKLVVRYNTQHYLGTANQYPFIVQAVLYEGSNLIEIHTTTISDVSAADVDAYTTLGVENQNGIKATTVPGRNSAHITVSNDAYRFTPYISYNYTWQPGGLNGDSQSLVPATSGIYTVNVADGSGCTITSTVAVNVNPAITITGTVTNVACKGNSIGAIAAIAAGGTPGFNYFWNNGNTTSNVSGLFAGNYTVTTTDAVGCTKTSSFVIVEPATILSISISKTNVRCGGKSTGIATAIPTGGSGTYTYLWNNNSTTDSRTGLAAGTYTVTITDTYGCSKTKSVVITQNTPMNLIVFPGIGSAIANPGGGVPPYTYFWNTSPSQTSQTATGLLANTTYKVKVNDTKGCSVIGTVYMNSFKSSLSVDAIAFDISIYPNPTDGILNLFSNCSKCDYFEIKIINSIGEKVLDEKRNPSNLQFDLSTYTKGIYLLDVTVGVKRKTIKVVVD